MPRNSLEIVPESACHQIELLLKDRMGALAKDGIIVGLSGGFDSAVTGYLAARAVGPERVRLLNLPERDSKNIHRDHAQLVADALGIALEVQDLTPILEAMGVYKLLPIGSIPGKRLRELTVRIGRSVMGFGPGTSILEARFRPSAGSMVAKGNAFAMAKHRLRMLILYQQAEVSNLMVVGAANRTELMTGTFSFWGCDHCADVMPIVHLYRSQLHPIARYLGLPKEIMEKSADPDVLPGIDNKEQLLGTFAHVDRILVLLEQGESREELNREFGEEPVSQLMRLIELSAPMREAPYSLI